jgi:hypothetical protein
MNKTQMSIPFNKLPWNKNTYRCDRWRWK